MSSTGAELFIEILESYGVTHLFGNPGTTELPVMDELQQSDIQYILGLHEDVAVGMAAGFAKTRQWHSIEDEDVFPLGVVNVHVAPGLAHGLGNVFDSGHLGSGAPLLITAGLHSTSHQHREPNLYGNVVEMADQFTKWSAEVKHIDALPSMVRRAARVAMTPPTGPVFLALPFDVMIASTTQKPERFGSIPVPGPAKPDLVSQACEAISKANEPLMIVGDYLARTGPKAVESAIELADRCNMHVHGEFRLSEAAFPTDHPRWKGMLPNDPELARERLDTDVAVIVGTISNVPTLVQNFPQSVFTETSVIDIGPDPWELGKNYIADLSISGDIGLVLDAMLKELADSTKQRQPVRSSHSSKEASGNVESDRDGVTNAILADSICRLTDSVRIIAEATTSVSALRTRGSFSPGSFSNYRGGGLGYGLAAAVGIGIAETLRDNRRDVIGFIGDGALLYYPNALYTAARYDIDLSIVVPNNRNYKVLKDKLPGLTGRDPSDHEYIGMELEPPIDIPGLAVAQGVPGTVVEHPDDLDGALADAINVNGPRLVDVRIVD